MSNQFDITKYKWSDGTATGASFFGGLLDMFPNNYIDKNDAIAIAKHFGIIQEIDGQKVTIHSSTIELNEFSARDL